MWLAAIAAPKHLRLHPISLHHVASATLSKNCRLTSYSLGFQRYHHLTLKHYLSSITGRYNIVKG